MLKPKAHFYSDDRSIILRIMGNVFFTPLVKAIPYSIKPNMITIIGFIGVIMSGVFVSLSLKNFPN